MPFVTAKTAASAGTWDPSPLVVPSVACGTAADTVIVGWVVGTSSAANALTGMTINGSATGVSASAEGTWGSDDHARLFWWHGTGPGTVPIRFTWTGDIAIASGGVAVWSGVGSLAGLVLDFALGGTTTPSVTVTSASGDLAVGIFAYGETGVSVDAAAEGSERLDEVASNVRHAVFEEPGDTSVTVNGTTTGGSIFPILWAGFSLVAASGDTTPPTITGPTGAAGASSISVNVAENTTACGTWSADESVTWSISGTDAAFFTIGSSTGVLTFNSAPDFEAPADSGANNTYDIVVTATDTATPTPNVSTQTVAINVTDASEDATSPSAPGTPNFSAITKSSATVTYAAATDNVAVTGYERRFNGGSVVDLGNVLTFNMTGQTPGATVTVEVRAYDAAGNRGAWASSDITFPIWGFAFGTLTNAIFGEVVGTLTGIAKETASTSWTLYVHDDATRAVILNTGTLTIDSNGRVADFSHASLDEATYFISGRRASDGAWVAARLLATDLS